MSGCILENKQLSVTVEPDMGGKSLSIYDKERHFELLEQKKPGRTGKTFAESAAYGYDDAFPCIDPGKVSVGDRMVEYPDHGEVWSSPMKRKQWDREQQVLKMEFESAILDYQYEKKVALQGRSVLYSYRIKNRGEHTFPCIWAFHCLVRYEKDMRILFPAGTDLFENVLDSASLGRKGTKYRTIHTDKGMKAEGSDYLFDRVPDPKSCSMEKYYVAEKVSEGLCGYDYPSQGVRVRIHFDPKKLPYLGFFVTAGGFQGDYNCALEPSSGYYDSIETAVKNGRCPVLGPQESLSFEIRVEIL